MTEREVEAIVNAVSPDNVNVPVGLRVETIKKKQSLLAIIRCDRPLKTLISTLDDLLACISVAEKSLSSLTS